jgi:hypothetical protein
MANTVTVDSNQQSLTGKTLSVQSELTSKLLTTVVDVVFGACDTYLTTGVTIDLSLGGRISTIIEATIISNDLGFILEYVPAALNAAATGKVKVRGVDPADAGGAITFFPEIANASALVNDLNIKIRVVGF